jgi:hypothetical protein
MRTSIIPLYENHLKHFHVETSVGNALKPYTKLVARVFHSQKMRAIHPIRPLILVY